MTYAEQIKALEERVSRLEAALERVVPTLPVDEVSPENRDIYDQLRNWALSKAQELGVPKYVVMPERCLVQLAEIQPKTIEQMTGIKGISEKRAAAYQDEIFTILHGADW